MVLDMWQPQEKAFGHLPTLKQSSFQYHSPSFDPLPFSFFYKLI